MPFLRPVPMVKVGLAGLKEDREVVLTLLHDLGVVQVEPVGPEALKHFEPERASDLARTVGEQLIRFRGLRSALPPTPVASPRHFTSLQEVLEATATVPVDDEVGRLKREEDALQTERKSLQDQVDLLNRFPFYREPYGLLRAKSLLAFFGEANAEGYPALKSAFPPGADATFVEGPVADETVRFIVAVRSDQAESVSRLAQQRGVTLTAAPALSGTAAEELPRLLGRVREIDERLGAIRGRLAEVARTWYSTVVAVEEALAIENRKLEVWTRLGAGTRTFALEGWVPARERAALQRELERVTSGRAHVYDLPKGEEPPTLMENPRGIRWYEFFIRFYSIPQATEWDPTWVFAIVFPIFFGLMLGDFGYGLVILLISLWMIRGFPGARYLPKFGKNFVKLIMGPRSMQSLAYTLLPGCGVAIGLGVLFDEFFGYPLLNAAFGYAAPSDPLRNVGTLLLLSGYIGLAMVTLGFLMGALKETAHHRPRHALGKVGGILFAWGVSFTGLAMIHKTLSLAAPATLVDLALMVMGILLLLGGEGVQMGAMGVIETVSHILSYTRLVGILLASVVLALVINDIGGGLAQSGSAVKFVAGLAIILIGQSFNVILGVFEPGIQGARLIFVEYFSKFYSGNGRAFHPFRSDRTHTLPSYGANGLARAAPAPAAPPAPSTG